MLRALLTAAPPMGLIGLGVGVIAVFGRDCHPDEHSVADYRPASAADRRRAGTLAPARRGWPLVDVDDVIAGRRLRSRAMADLILPPVPADTTVGLPVYAETVVAQVAGRYGSGPEAIAARWLRELGEQARAQLAVTR